MERLCDTRKCHLVAIFVPTSSESKSLDLDIGVRCLVRLTSLRGHGSLLQKYFVATPRDPREQKPSRAHRDRGWNVADVEGELYPAMLHLEQ